MINARSCCYDLDSLLASAMLDNGALESLLLVTSTDLMSFPETPRNLILAAIREVHRADRPVDIVTVYEALARRDSGIGLDELSDMLNAPLLEPLLAGSLCIRPFRASDIPAYVEAVRESVDTVGQWLPWCSHDFSEIDAVSWIARCRQRRLDGSDYDLGIFSADGETLHGSVAINHIDPGKELGNLGYWVRTTRQRQGLARCAALRMIDFAFDELHLSRVQIAAAENNVPSRRLAEGLGATLQGIFRIHRIVASSIAQAAAIYELQRSSN